MKIVKYIVRSIVILLTIVVSMLILLYAGIHLPYVQKFITTKIAENISEKFSVKISIESVDIGLWNKVKLQGVLITNNDSITILKSNEITASLYDFNIEKKTIDLEKFSFENAKLQICKDSLGSWNIDGFLNTKKATNKSWEISVFAIEFINSHIIYKNEVLFTPKQFGVNYNDIDAKNVNLFIHSFFLKDGTYSAAIEKLSGTEKSGFSLTNLSALINLSDTLLTANNIRIFTQNSKIHATNITFNYKQYADFKDFINNIKIDASLDYSDISLHDIAYFAPTLEYNPYSFSIAGTFKGKVKDFRTKNLKIGYGQGTIFNGNIEISGLPEINESFIHIEAQEFITNSIDISSLRLPPFTEKKFFNPPAIIKELKVFNYSGTITGFTKDFVAYGLLKTIAGEIQSDISIKESNTSNDFVYSGNVSFKKFNLNRVVNQKNVWGKTNFSAKIVGIISNGSFKTAFIQGKVANIEVLGYDYKNVLIDGLLSNKKFDGHIEVLDTNAMVIFHGLFDYSDEVAQFKFDANITHANLFALHLQDDSLANISLQAKVDFLGLQLDNLKGYVQITKANYQSKFGDYNSDNISIKIDNIGDSRNINLASDLVDISINGKGRYKELSNYLYSYLEKHIPSLPKKEFANEKTIPPQFNMSIRIKKIDSLLRVVYPSVEIAQGSFINTIYDDQSNLFIFDSKFPHIKFGSQLIENLSVHSEGNSSNLQTVLNYDLPLKSKTISDITSFVTISNDSIQYTAEWDFSDSTEFKGKLSGIGKFSQSKNATIPAISLQIFPSVIVLADTIWNISESKFEIDSTSITVKNASISKNNQSIEIEGTISENKDDMMNAHFQNYNIENFNYLIKTNKVYFEGPIIGTLHIQDFYNSRLIFADLETPHFKFNNHELGTLVVKSNWDKEKENLNMNITLTKGQTTVLQAEGAYTPSSQKIDYDISINNLKLSDFSEILEPTLTNFSGYADGKFTAVGKYNSPEFTGSIKITRGKLTVDYTKTPYNIKGELYGQDSRLVFKDISVSDTIGNTAKANGYFELKDLINPSYKISIETDKILGLNTTEHDNEMFYGKAFYKGNATIFGDLYYTNFSATGKTIDQSIFSIPLSYSELSESYDFLFFGKRDSISVIEKEENTNKYTGTDVNINLEVNQDALCQIIFDQKVGDIIKVRGNANIQMLMNKQGDFTMFGEYIINEGDYLFTLKNLINKKFVIQKGGLISWNGDPLNAQLDVTADYNLKASIKPLMIGIDSSSASNYNKRIPVACRINLQNDLMRPDLKYDIYLPNNSGQAKDVVDNLDEDQKNIQFLSLLLVNSFLNLQDNTTGNNAVGVNTSSYEVLTSQLNQLLSKIENAPDIGVNYRPGNASTANEFEVAVSTQMLNNRVLVNLNGYTEFGQTTATTNEQQNDFSGDISVEVKLNDEGNLRVKGFSRSNTDPLDENQSNTQGIGLFFSKEFNYFKDFFDKK